MVAWGANDSGQTNVPCISNVIAIAAGYRHGLALQLDGEVIAWGSNNYNQTDIPIGLSNVVSIAVGTDNSLALLTNNQVVAWGKSDVGQTNIPLGLINLKKVSGGESHLGALLGENLPQTNIILKDARIVSDEFAVSLSSESGRVYRLEYKTNLSDNTWTALPLVAGNSGDLTLTANSPAGTQRFYRVPSW